MTPIRGDQGTEPPQPFSDQTNTVGNLDKYCFQFENLILATRKRDMTPLKADQGTEPPASFLSNLQFGARYDTESF